MNILFVSNMYPSSERPSYGVFVKNVFDEMQRTHTGKLTLCAMTYSKSKLWPYFSFYLKFLYLLMFSKVDTVYCHFISRTSILGAVAKFIFGKKVIFNIHGSDYLLPKNKNSIFHRINLWAINFCDGLVVPSNAFRQLILPDIGKELEPKLFVSPSGGVNVSGNYQYDSNSALPLKCLFVGRVSAMKGIDTVIDALNQVSWDIELTVVGKVEQDLFASLKNGHVSLTVVGEVTQEALEQYYSQSSLFLFPTKYFESLGLTPIEAMSHGLPVIGSDYGPVPEYVRDGYNGFLIEKGNSEQLLERLAYFSSLSPTQRQDLSINAVDTALQYSREKVVENLLYYMESCCENE
ncbi:glycosyltransferase family 4 protein [Shewanella atlantica]|uniref:glycosyltransferase family 4 protein n=1 Tax=Shewanella atlantica TaxID=271099 RepID=UPI0037353EF5